jgi:uncharacterized protein YcfL
MKKLTVLFAMLLAGCGRVTTYTYNESATIVIQSANENATYTCNSVSVNETAVICFRSNP